MRRLGREERRALTLVLFAAAALTMATQLRELWLVEACAWWSFAAIWLLLVVVGGWMAWGGWDHE